MQNISQINNESMFQIKITATDASAITDALTMNEKVRFGKIILCIAILFLKVHY